MQQYFKKSMTLVKSKLDFSDLLRFIAKSQSLVIDTETSGLRLWQDDFVSAIGIGDIDRQFFLDLRPDCLDYEISLSELFDSLRKTKVIIGHNIKFDLAGLLRLGYEVPDNQEIHDTIVMARLLSIERFPKLGLTPLIQQYISEFGSQYDIDFKQFLKTNKIKLYSQSPSLELGIYCLNDVYYTASLYEKFKQSLVSLNLVGLWNHEIKVTKTVWKMEKQGVLIDKKYCSTALSVISLKSKQLESEINEVAGEDVNLGSNKQLSKFFRGLKLEAPTKTKKGGESWGEASLILLDHPVAKKLLSWRGLQKLKTSYFETYLERESPLHCSFKNWGTVTGRFSCVDPNFQQLPKELTKIFDEDETKELSEFQKAAIALVKADKERQGGGKLLIKSVSSYEDDIFDEEKHISAKRSIVPRDGNVFLSFDYSQMELKILFFYLNNDEARQYLSDPDWDGHSWVATKIWGISDKDPSFPAFRKLAKAINFGIIYGEGDRLLAAQLGKTVNEAKKFREEYYAKIPGIRDLINGIHKKVQTRGYVFNYFGRRYYADQDREYVLLNYLIQGTSADLIKNRMVAIDNDLELRSIGLKLILQIHDELIFECPKDKIDYSVKLVKQILEFPVLKVPLASKAYIHYPSLASKFDYGLNWRDNAGLSIN
ncbi:hypothetical protein HYS94_01700 [Candidatus Daviesbacteria bacterium]|nr:hypothetical protein [Candidatus Daviesbacteria bacterium]